MIKFEEVEIKDRLMCVVDDIEKVETDTIVDICLRAKSRIEDLEDKVSYQKEQLAKAEKVIMKLVEG